jgi:hypothetical protein
MKVQRLISATVAHLGAIKAHPGAKDDRPGEVDAHPGTMEAHPGAVLDSPRSCDGGSPLTSKDSHLSHGGST